MEFSSHQNNYFLYKFLPHLCFTLSFINLIFKKIPSTNRENYAVTYEILKYLNL